MSRILVTGAGGFLGCRLVKVLAGRGHSVLAATRKPVVWPSPVTGFILNTNDPSYFSTLPAVDVIVHAAAERVGSSMGFEKASLVLQTNVLGTFNVLRFAESCKARVIYCSSVSVYALPQPLPINEAGPTYPVNAADSVYAISKLAGEMLCTRAHVEGRLKALSLRLGRVYGPGEPADTLLSQWIEQARNGIVLEVHGNGERSLDFIYVDDAVKGLADAVDTDATDPILNLSRGEEITWETLAKTVSEVFSPPGSPPAIRLVRKGATTRCWMDVLRAKSALSFSPQYSLRDGLLSWRGFQQGGGR